MFKNEADILFINKKKKKIENLNLKYNHRYFARIANDVPYFKDDFFDFFIRMKNFLI